MTSHIVRRVAWGLTWRWSILLASLITPAPPAATAAIAVLLAAGLVAALWRRYDLLGSAWRLLLAVSVINLGFWLGGALLLPAITLAVVVTIGDLWWSIAGIMLEGVRPDTVATGVPADAPLSPIVPIEPFRPIPRPEPILSIARPETIGDPRRRRASRGRMPAGLRLLVAACMLVAVGVVTAPAIASRASAGLSTALTSIGQRVNGITAAVSSAPAPAASAQPTPSPTPPNSTTAIAPSGGDNQPPAEPSPTADAPGLCVSLPDGRYEVRLPNGQVIVVTTRHRAGCPDLATILKALANASGDSD